MPKASLRASIFCLLAFLPGCSNDSGSAREVQSERLERGLGQDSRSLLSIGASSNELGERCEDSGQLALAANHYSRAIWAFSQHQFLTGQQPALLDDARENLARVNAAIAAHPAK